VQRVVARGPVAGVPDVGGASFVVAPLRVAPLRVVRLRVGAAVPPRRPLAAHLRNKLVSLKHKKKSFTEENAEGVPNQRDVTLAACHRNRLSKYEGPRADAL